MRAGCAAVKLRLLYFARLRELFGHGGETIELMPGTVADLLAALRHRGRPWSDELAAGRAFRVAVNQDMATADTALADGDEVAIFPPVTGG
jgi:molybdopterin synthase sulfur carrier subunit